MGSSAASASFVTRKDSPHTRATKTKKKYEAGMWGLSIKTKERLKSKHDTPMPFGVVVTLKEMHGKNRINDFIQMCQLNGWIVNRIDIDNRIDIYNVAEEDVEFE